MRLNTPILITGAAGLAGYWLTQALQARGYRQLILTDLANPDRLPDIITGSITDPLFVHKLIEESRPEVIFHLAGIVGNGAPDLLEEVNVGGTELLLKAVVDSALIDSRVVLVSSSAVYGDHGKNPITEEMELRPTSPYSFSKVKQETVGLRFYKEHGVKVVIARTFNNFAPREKAQMFISRIASQIVKIERGEQEKLEIGPMFSYRDYIDTRDAVNGYIQLALKGQAGESYNICSGSAVLIQDLFDHLIASATQKIPYDVIEYDQRGNIPYQVGTPGKLIETTDWSIDFDIKQTLTEMLDYWRYQ